MQFEPVAEASPTLSATSQANTWRVLDGQPVFELVSATGERLTPGWHLVTTDITTTTADEPEHTANPPVSLSFLSASGAHRITRKPIPSVRGRRVRVVHVPEGTGRVDLEVSPWVDTVTVSHVTIRPLSSAAAASLMAADLAASSVAGVTNRTGLLHRLNDVRADRGSRATLEEVAHAYDTLQKQRAADTVDYEAWRLHHATLTEEDRERLIERGDALPGGGPLISVVMAVYDPGIAWLTKAVESVFAQTYSNWQLCLVNDASPDPEVAARLDEFAAGEKRVMVHHREQNGHIAAATNDGLHMATGEFVAFMDHDDELAPFALSLIALESSGCDILYTDEDKIDAAGHHYGPHFKPTWNPELLLGQNYMSHLTAIRRSVITEVGGMRSGFDGSQDHDLVLRATAATTAERICHIPYVGYHWRAIKGSTALAPGEKNYTETASIRALKDRLGNDWNVELANAPTAYKCTPPLDSTPLVSIIIPTRDRLGVVTQCVDSLATTTYPNYEILIADNDSEEADTLDWFAAFENGADQRVISTPGAFNFSAINNSAVQESNGELVLLLNNDTEVINPDWLTEMVRWILQDDVGVVGAKLLYPHDTIQHAGVVLGFGGFAGHGQSHEPANATGYFNRLAIAHEIGAVTGACLLTKRETWDALGGLEETLAVAFNDIDYCLRVRHEAGQRIIWTPEALLYHHESVSRGRDDDPEKVARFLGEIDLVMERWGRVLDQDPAYSPNLSLEGYTFTIARQPRVAPPWRLRADS